jgi:hypothetical protein
MKDSYLHQGRSSRNRPRLVILTCVWKRLDLTAIVLSSYREMRERMEDRIELVLLAVGSEGAVSRELCEENGFAYLEHPNSPLSHKWNAGVRAAEPFNPDGLVIVGSDDFISDNLLESWVEKLRGGYHFFGIRDLYVLDLPSSRLGYWGGYEYSALMPYRAGEPIGLGRCFSRYLLEATDWNLWPPEPRLEKGLDELSLKFVGKHSFEAASWCLDDLEAYAVDIKSGTNITAFDNFDFQRMSCDGKAYRRLSSIVSPRILRRLAEIQPGT